MADNLSGLTAATKKNKKKLQKKAASKPPQDDDNSELIELKEKLKERLQQAKDAKDHVTAGKLREQIWIMNDIIAGIRTDMPEDEIRAVLEGLPLPELEGKKKPDESSTPTTTAPSGDAGVTGAGLSEPEKRIKTLKKKLGQIEKMKEKKSKGETLEKNQLDKIESEDAILKEIEELEAAISKAMANLNL